MSAELLIVSEAAEFSSALGIALTQRGAWRVSLARDVEAALQAQPTGLILLDSVERDAGPALARQLHEFGADVVVHCCSRVDGVDAALTALEQLVDNLAAAPLEPLAGDESDAGNWRYVSEPEFLRAFAPDGRVAAVARDNETPGESTTTEEAEVASPPSAPQAPGVDASAADLDALVQRTAARFALLRGPDGTVLRSGELDEETQARLPAPDAVEDGGQSGERLFIVDLGDAREGFLLYVRDAGQRQLSVLVPDDSSLRELRGACERFLREMD